MVHDKANVVPVRATAEAVIKPLVVVDVERRRFLVVKRTARRPLPTLALQLDARAHHVGQIQPRADFVKKGGWDGGQGRVGSFWCAAALPTHHWRERGQAT